MALEKIIQNYDLQAGGTVGNGPDYMGITCSNYHFLVGEDCFRNPEDFCDFISEGVPNRPKPMKIYRLVEYEPKTYVAKVEEVKDKRVIRKFMKELHELDMHEIESAKVTAFFQEQMKRIIHLN